MLTRLKVQNYKSLENVEIPLRPLTVFVGPNNAGKSNILDCLQFTQEAMQSLATAISSRGGFEYVVWGGDLSRRVQIRVDGVVEVSGKKLEVGYGFNLMGGADNWGVEREEFVVFTDNPPRWIRDAAAKLEAAVKKRFEGRERERILEDDSSESVLHAGSVALNLSLSIITDPDKQSSQLAFLEMVQRWAFYKSILVRADSPQPVRRDLLLSEEGTNLSSVLHSYQAEYREQFSEIENLLRSGIPEVEHLISALTEDGHTLLHCRERDVPLSIPIWAMSEGTRRWLALLAAVFSPKPPPLICIEEPENCIHPRLLEMLADVLQSASERTQILLTTHSPYLLNWMDPEDVVVVEKVEGKTLCKAIADFEKEDKDVIREALKVLGLGEFWYSGSMGGVP